MTKHTCDWNGLSNSEEAEEQSFRRLMLVNQHGLSEIQHGIPVRPRDKNVDV
jgi:hypothetical protein